MSPEDVLALWSDAEQARLISPDDPEARVAVEQAERRLGLPVRVGPGFRCITIREAWEAGYRDIVITEDTPGGAIEGGGVLRIRSNIVQQRVLYITRLEAPWLRVLFVGVQALFSRIRDAEHLLVDRVPSDGTLRVRYLKQGAPGMAVALNPPDVRDGEPWPIDLPLVSDEA